MSEIPTFSPKKIEEAHEEALTINAEVDERSKFADLQVANSELAQIAIDQRSELAADYFCETPEIMDKIRRQYAYRSFHNGEIEIYIDPSLSKTNSKNDEFCQYFDTPKFDEDMLKFRELIPATYLQPDNIPPIFIQSVESATELNQPRSAGFVTRNRITNKRNNINIVSDPDTNRRSTFFHELSHVCEDGEIDDFREAIAKIIDHEVRGLEIHDSMLSVYFAYGAQNKNRSGHPITRMISKEKSNVSILGLYRRPVSEWPHDSDFRNAEMCRLYYMVGSFLSWFQKKYDPHLKIIDRNSDTTPHYSTASTVFHDKFPTEMRKVSHQGQVRQMPRSTVPIHLANFPSQTDYLGIQDDDPRVSELVDRLGPATTEEAAQLVGDFRKLAYKELLRIEAEYNHFLTEKIHQKYGTPKI